MLWLIGIGIHGYKGISIHALDILKRCDIVYIERFTSALSDDDLQGLNSLIRKNDNSIIPVERWFVEDGREILEKANNKEL
jgi:diphthamide biosynthesis methyltransferase